MLISGSSYSDLEYHYSDCSGGYAPLYAQYIVPHRPIHDNIHFQHVKCRYCGALNKQFEDLECRKCGAPLELVW
jgi:hypothetical protein